MMKNTISNENAENGYAEFEYGAKKYRVKISEVERTEGVMYMPGGRRAIYLKDVYVEYSDDHDNKSSRPILRFSNKGFDLWASIIIGPSKSYANIVNPEELI